LAEAELALRVESPVVPLLWTLLGITMVFLVSDDEDDEEDDEEGLFPVELFAFIALPAVSEVVFIVDESEVISEVDGDEVEDDSEPAES